MKHLLTLLGTLAFAVCSTAAESDWTKSIAALVPANITITKIEQSKDVVEMTGQSNSNTDISALMKTIDKANLGTPLLQEIRRKKNVSKFVIRVQAKR